MPIPLSLLDALTIKNSNFDKQETLDTGLKMSWKFSDSKVLCTNGADQRTPNSGVRQ